MIRLLKASEIETRVQTVTAKGCSLLLFKDARVDMKVLDETFGANGWQRKHEVINDNLFCTISIWDNENKQWIDKQDVGTESYTEKEKGQASDAFKRAGFNVGIGRELYTGPFIWINLTQDELYENGKDNRNKPKFGVNPRVKFKVKEIGYNDDREIDALVIVDLKGRVRFELGNIVANKVEQKTTESQVKKYMTLTKKLTELNKFDNQKFMKNIKDKYGVNNVVELQKDDMEEILNLFEITIEKLAKK